ncbi:MAG: thioesterase [Deltaproteobacteria bacterium]|nr:MAG: thioesterase [Deltaproteobacteria bacterium]
MATNNPDQNLEEKKAFQDYYADDYAHCFGCGRLNDNGFQLKSYWDGDESVCHFSPKAYHTGGKKNIVYGGLIAALMDCHGAATAAAAKSRELGGVEKTGEMPRFVTAYLRVEYLLPTPIGCDLELRGRVKEVSGRKVFIEADIIAEEKVCAKGDMLFIQIKA